MGVDYYAYAVIGVLLPEIPLAKKRVRKPAFKHGYQDDGNVEYDPKTGAKLWLEEVVEVPAEYPGVVFSTSYTDRNGKECNDYHLPLREGQSLIRIPKHLNIARATHVDKTYIGFVVRAETLNTDSSTKVKTLPDISVLKEELKDLLEPYSLWRDELFGLHSVLVCSY